MMTPDAELLRRYVHAGAEDAFAELVERHLSLVYNAAWRRTGDPHRAEEVTQYVFTELARRAAALSQHAVLTGWLYTTTRFAAAKLMRSERRRQAREREASLMQETTGSEPPLENAANWDRLRPVVDAAMDELPERDREAVLLRFFAGLPFAEIGVALRTSEDAARMRVQRALEKLREMLVARGVTSTAAGLGLVLTQHAAQAVVPTGFATGVTAAALAGAVSLSGVAGVTGMIAFMSTSKIFVGVAVLMGAAGMGTAWYEIGQAKRANTALNEAVQARETARSEMNTLAAKRREAEEALQSSQSRIAALEKQLAGLRTTAGPGTATAAITPLASIPGVDPMLSNPDYFRLSMQRYRGTLGAQFGLLYKKLGFTAQQIEAFEANRTAYHQASQELLSVASAQGMTTSDPAFSKLAGSELGVFEKELAQMLGPTDFGIYQLYSRAAVREMVGGVAAATLHAEDGLTAGKANQLAELVMASTKVVPIAPGSKTVRYETNWDAIGTQAQGFLTRAQAAALQSLIEGKKLQEQMSALRSKAAAPPAPAKSGD